MLITFITEGKGNMFSTRLIKDSATVLLMISLVLASLSLLLPLFSPPSPASDALVSVNVQSEKNAAFKPNAVGEERGEINRTYVVTLVTGDVVTAGVTRDNRTIVLGVAPYDPTRFNRGFRVLEDERGVYVIPSDVDLRKADLNLFNVKYLIEEEYYKLPNTPLIVELSKKFPSNKALTAVQSILNVSKNERITRNYKVMSAASVQISPGETFYKLLSSDYISKIWLNYRVKALLYESAPLIGAPEVWNLGYNGSGVKIAILDTGIDPTHPFFYFSNGTSKIIAQVDFTDDNDPYDYFGHGTHVASIAAGTELNTSISLYSYIREYASNEWFEYGEPMNWRADDGCWELYLPFQFPFYGVNYTRIYVSSNGLISFLNPDTSYWSSVEELSRRLAIAVAWDDWRTDIRSGDDIYVWQPDNGSLAIRWRVVAYYNNNLEANFGAILYSNGTIKCFYGYSNGAVSATIGVSNGQGHIVAEDLENINYIDTRIFKPHLVVNVVVLSGIAPEASLMNVKVLNRYGWGYLEWVIAGVEYAALGPDGEPNTGDEADILNLSLGAYWWTDGTDPLSMACDAAVDLGCVVVVAAGNWGGYFSIGVPATARKVITVGASDKLDYIAYFSSRGPTVDFRVKPDLVAPGVNIWAALAKGSLIEHWANQSWIPGMDVDGDGRYDFVCLSGTSMATPHVSGAAALVKQARQLDSTMIKNLLISTSKDLGYDVYTQGGGRLNVLAAIESDILVSPATVSLGRIARNAVYNFNLTLMNVGDETIEISLYPSLTRIWYGGDYSNFVSLNVTELSLPAGESRGVMVTINAAGLPAGYYSGLINTNYTVASSNLHVIFGFTVINKIDVTFYGLDGATPLRYCPVMVFRANATTWEEYYVDLRHTDDYGKVTFYILDGLFYIVGFDGGRSEYCNAYAIEKVWVTGDLNITLSLECAHKISYAPPGSNQIVASLINGIFYAYYMGIGLSNYWYYPLSTDIYVTSTDLIFFSSYQHYDRSYINVPDPSVLIAPELYSTIFVNKSITGSKTVSFSRSQLTKVEKNYKVALTPHISARIFRRTYVYSPDWYWWGIGIGGIEWRITSPKTLTEYLGLDIPPSAYHWHYVGYRKDGDQPNIWTPYFEFYGYERYWEPGTFSLDINSHPLDPSIYIDVWSYEDGNRARLYFDSDFFCKTVSGSGYYSHNYLVSDYGIAIVKINGTEIYRDEGSDRLGFWADIDLPAKIEVEVKARSNMYLSTEATTRIELEVPVDGSIWLSDPFSIRIDELDLNNTHPGGNIRGFIYKLAEMRNTTLEYSLDDGETWSPVTLSEEPEYYRFTLPTISDKFVSLRINSTMNDDFEVSYTIIRGLYVKPLTGIGRLRVETIPPVPTRIFLDGVVRNSWGLDWVRLSAGYYRLSFSDVPYRETPRYVEVTIWPENVTTIVPLSEPIPIYPDKTTEVKAYFEPLGSLRIQTVPPVPVTIYVDGIPRNEWGLWVDIEPGNYTISFEPYPGYKTPPPIVVSVERGKLTHVIGNYTDGTTIIVEQP